MSIKSLNLNSKRLADTYSVVSAVRPVKVPGFTTVSDELSMYLAKIRLYVGLRITSNSCNNDVRPVKEPLAMDVSVTFKTNLSL